MTDEEVVKLGFKSTKVDPFVVNGINLRVYPGEGDCTELDMLLIPKGACKLCTSKCDTSGLRCTNFINWYDKDLLHYDKMGFTASRKYLDIQYDKQKEEFINNLKQSKNENNRI